MLWTDSTYSISDGGPATNLLQSIKHNLIYSLITIRLATCFDPTGSSSGLLYEPVNARNLRTFLESQQCLQMS